MSYNVYLVSYQGMPRNHHAIFVETHEDGENTGFLYQVSGNIKSGMKCQHRKEIQPELSDSFAGLKQLIGTVTITNHPQLYTIVETVPAPKKQFEGAKMTYPREPLRRCQEWTGEAIQALIECGVLEDVDTGLHGGSLSR